jgi:hypothetical protein
MNTGISRFVIRFPEKIALLEGIDTPCEPGAVCEHDGFFQAVGVAAALSSPVPIISPVANAALVSGAFETRDFTGWDTIGNRRVSLTL